MILYLDERIQKEMVDKVSVFLDKHQRPSLENPNFDTPVIYLTSNGGEYAAGQVLTDILNCRPDTELIAARFIGSAAFTLFFNAKCKKRLLPGTMGCLHQSSTSIEMDERWKPTYKNDVDTKEFINIFCKKDTLDLCKSIGMTKKETDSIVRYNHDTFFQYPRMMEFLKFTEQQKEANPQK